MLHGISNKQKMIAALLASTTALTIHSSAFAAFGDQNGELTFGSQRNTGMTYELFTSNNPLVTETATSITPLQLTAESTGAAVSGNKLQQAWSPDGKKLAFICDDLAGDRDQEVCIADAQTAVTRQVTNDTDNAFSVIAHHPSWSPDGTQLVYSATAPERPNEDIYRINIDGSNRTDLTPNTVSDQNPTWSYDGTKIAFASQRYQMVAGRLVPIFQIITADITPTVRTATNQQEVTRNTADSNNPTWSPSGNQIAYDSPSATGDLDIFRFDLGTNTNVRVTRQNTGIDAEPSWSPDGKKIAFTSARNGNLDIYMIDSDGDDNGNLIRVTTNAAADGYPSWRSVRSPDPVKPQPPVTVSTQNSEQKSGEQRTSSSATDGLARITNLRFLRVKTSKKSKKKRLVAEARVDCPIQSGCKLQLRLSARLAKKGKKSVLLATGNFKSTKPGSQVIRMNLSTKALRVLKAQAKKQHQKRIRITVDAKNLLSPSSKVKSFVKVLLLPKF